LIPYWIVFAFFALGCLFYDKNSPDQRVSHLGLALGFILVSVAVGLRYEVGGDWGNYIRIYRFTEFMELSDVFSREESLYLFLNWLAQKLSAEIWLVNVVSATIFAWGLFRLARVQPNPWLALLVATPYVIVVVAMGYTRQSVALGILMAGLATLIRGGSGIRFTLYVVVAALFHKTAVIGLPLALVGVGRNRLLNILFVGLSAYLLFEFFISSSLDRLVRNYVVSEFDSQGALIRILMCVLPALIFLWRAKAFRFNEVEQRLWLNFSLASLLCLALLSLVSSSAPIDRMALYLTPLQIAVLGSVPGVYLSDRLGTLAVGVYSAAALYVWLNYADWAFRWVPYHLYPF
jgi:hypothetical protein